MGTCVTYIYEWVEYMRVHEHMQVHGTCVYTCEYAALVGTHEYALLACCSRESREN